MRTPGQIETIMKQTEVEVHKIQRQGRRRIPRSQYPHKAAEYIAQEQWKRNRENLPRPKHNPECLTRGEFPSNDLPFTLEELNVVIGKQGNSKAPGTDNLRAELVKYPDEEKRLTPLRHFNHIHHTGKLEASVHEASVVSIFKKRRFQQIGKLSLCFTFTNILQIDSCDHEGSISTQS